MVHETQKPTIILKFEICFKLFSCFVWASRYSLWKERVILYRTLFIYGWVNRQLDVFQGIDIFAQTVAACNMVCNLSLLRSNERIRHILFFFFADRSTGRNWRWNLLSSPYRINYLKNINFHLIESLKDIFHAWYNYTLVKISVKFLKFKWNI